MKCNSEWPLRTSDKSTTCKGVRFLLPSPAGGTLVDVRGSGCKVHYTNQSICCSVCRRPSGESSRLDSRSPRFQSKFSLASPRSGHLFAPLGASRQIGDSLQRRDAAEIDRPPLSQVSLETNGTSQRGAHSYRNHK